MILIGFAKQHLDCSCGRFETRWKHLQYNYPPCGKTMFSTSEDILSVNYNLLDTDRSGRPHSYSGYSVESILVDAHPQLSIFLEVWPSFLLEQSHFLNQLMTPLSPVCYLSIGESSKHLASSACYYVLLCPHFAILHAIWKTFSVLGYGPTGWCVLII